MYSRRSFARTPTLRRLSKAVNKISRVVDADTTFSEFEETFTLGNSYTVTVDGSTVPAIVVNFKDLHTET